MGGPAPDCLADLNLDQVIADVTAGREEYELASFFSAPLTDAASVAYRQAVFRDLDDQERRDAITTFGQAMDGVRERLAKAGQLHHRHQRTRWFLDAAARYARAVTALVQALDHAGTESSGLSAIHGYLRRYVAREAFAELVEDATRLEAALGDIRYCVHIKGLSVRVTAYADQPDYSAEVEDVFEKFAQGQVRDYRVGLPGGDELNHIEAQVLDCVAELFPEVFASLEAFAARHADFQDDVLRVFDREVQFYLAYREHTRRLAQAGRAFCYPEISSVSKETHATATFDLALAATLAGRGTEIVPNDWHLTDPERIIVVSGPNQGGKTTFARTFGQLHYLAALGCPVPGEEARLFLCDRLFTHFEREEDIARRSGKLEDDLVRIHGILEHATSRSVVVMNESLTSTTLQDARFLGRVVLEEIIRRDLLCVYVTFVEELASLGETTVSMTSTVDPTDPAVRTFRVVRHPPDGLAYAAAIARRHGLTYETLSKRIAA